MVRYSLHCRGPEREIGQGWKFGGERLRRSLDLVMECSNGRWAGPRTWEVSISATDLDRAMGVDYYGLQWTDEQRKWFERHMKKLVREGL